MSPIELKIRLLIASGAPHRERQSCLHASARGAKAGGSALFGGILGGNYRTNLEMKTIRCLKFSCEEGIVDIIAKQRWGWQPFQLDSKP